MLRQLVTSCGQYPVIKESIVKKSILCFYVADSAHLVGNVKSKHHLLW